jgi:hypothetical protein
MLPPTGARRCATRMPGLIAILLLASGCASISGLRPTPAPGEYCEIYEPVPTHDATPEAAQRVIDRNNAAWLALGCETKTEALRGGDDV